VPSCRNGNGQDENKMATKVRFTVKEGRQGVPKDHIAIWAHVGRPLLWRSAKLRPARLLLLRRVAARAAWREPAHLLAHLLGRPAELRRRRAYLRRGPAELLWRPRTHRRCAAKAAAARRRLPALWTGRRSARGPAAEAVLLL